MLWFGHTSRAILVGEPQTGLENSLRCLRIFQAIAYKRSGAIRTVARASPRPGRGTALSNRLGLETMILRSLALLSIGAMLALGVPSLAAAQSTDTTATATSTVPVKPKPKKASAKTTAKPKSASASAKARRPVAKPASQAKAPQPQRTGLFAALFGGSDRTAVGAQPKTVSASAAGAPQRVLARKPLPGPAAPLAVAAARAAPGPADGIDAAGQRGRAAQRAHLAAVRLLRRPVRRRPGDAARDAGPRRGARREGRRKNFKVKAGIRAAERRLHRL